MRTHVTDAGPAPAAAGAPPASWVGAVIGAVTALVALAAAQLAAALFAPQASPVLSVGSAFIDATPEWLKSFAIRTFGSADKPVLLGGIAATVAVAAIVLGVVSLRRPWAPVWGIGVLAVAGVLAAVTRPGATFGASVPTLLGAVVGLWVYTRLRRAAGLSPLWEPAAPEDRQPETPGGFDRRRFLWSSAAAAGLAVVTDRGASWLIARSDASDSRAQVIVPDPFDVAPPPPSGADLGVPGVAPFITPNDIFYRIDTALIVPSLPAASWRLDIGGMVDAPLSLTYDQLIGRPLIERDVTIACVSNEVGGDYIGTARWVGVSLADLLDEVGVQPGADQLVSRSSDGWTAGTPVEAVRDGRDAMLAISMNGEPLPLEHGFPVRMIVPGLYGYVSATKWLVELELSTFAAFDPYWIRRGWAEQAPIKTQSRIDTPRSSAQLGAGPIVIGGVAWAQGRGIEAVEVSIDDGDWRPATLGAEDTVDTWRQWKFDWMAPAGSHTIAVRATDGVGQVQTDQVAPPFPDGATGYHRVTVEVV